jgi:hypothetical protein
VIVVDCSFGLGNQMFQYAFGLAAAHRLGTTFAVDESRLAALFVLGDRRQVAAVDVEHYPTVRIGFGDEDYNRPEELVAALQDNTRYIGFFQSDRFFADVAGDVREAFRLHPHHEDVFHSRYGDLLQRPYVCCHVRRKDYLTFAGGVALPTSYYERSLARLAQGRETPVVFVGDDLTEVQTAFGHLENARFEQNDEALDLQLLINAQTVVVSNSTFGWWGAWLLGAGGPSKRVLAPRDWLGFNRQIGWARWSRHAGASRHRVKRGWEYPPGIIPAGWTKVPAERRWKAWSSRSALKSSAALRVNNTLALLGKLRREPRQSD